MGLNETHNFGKYKVTGEGARVWLNRIMAGRIPEQGSLSLTPLLLEKGRLIGDFSVSYHGKNVFK